MNTINIAKRVFPDYNWEPHIDGKIYGRKQLNEDGPFGKLLETREFSLDDPACFLAAWEYLLDRGITILKAEYHKGKYYYFENYARRYKPDAIQGDGLHETKEKALEAAFAALES